ncbi:hypothetical protein BD410DRAFT_721351 [Rickenella mellea]|uniref:VWFA domain-containing protein n=1 Tax=Rickenella mellea TaxID=50990 RepID=A0A4Y7Q8N0_9AGAM|nr:hypothetical protein BD410DRAFT_721351 [Rickenella mellea]
MDANELDLVERIDGMFRILDLITEQGSGGLVDKIIIAQEQFSDLINELCPGSYRSLTKVDFHSLDKIAVKPMGVYGSKTEIVRLMRSVGVIDEEIEKILLAPRDTASGISKPDLRPGLYALFCPHQGQERKVYVVFWPEDTTWNDDAVSTVTKNRINFMRYLTQITDQIIAVISDEHCRRLVWTDDQDDMSTLLEVEDSERLFKFEVSKTNEQEEDVELSPGFKINHRAIKDTFPVLGVKKAKLKPRIIGGDTRQAMLFSCHIPAAVDVTKTIESYSPIHLRSFLNDQKQTFRFDHQLSDKSLKILIENGLGIRYPAVNLWEDARKSVARDEKDSERMQVAELKKSNEAGSSKVAIAVECEILEVVLKKFPTLERRRLESECKGLADEVMIDSKSMFLLFPRPFLANLFAVHPNIPKDQQICEALAAPTLGRLGAENQSFVKSKEIILLCEAFFPVLVDQKDRGEFLQCLVSEDMNGADRILPDLEKSHTSRLGAFKNTMKTVLGFATDSTASTGKLKDAKEKVMNATSDEDYLSKLSSIMEEQPLLRDLAQRSITLVHEHFSTCIRNATAVVKTRAEFLQHEACKKEVSREHTIRRMEKERVILGELLSRLNGDEDTSAYVDQSPNSFIHNSSFVLDTIELTFTHKIRNHTRINYTIEPLQVSERDRQELRMHPDYIPLPSFNPKHSTSFSLPAECEIRNVCLLDDDKCLLIIDNGRGHLEIYLEVVTAMDRAIQRTACKKQLHKDKMGSNAIVAFDERKRMIAVCGCNAVHLRTFIFDETFTSLQGQGGAIDLGMWYDEMPTIQTMCFISGTEELAMFEANGRTRIFSFASQQFRPASLQLPTSPHAAFSSPDGSCLIALFKESGVTRVVAHHWNSFGSKAGFPFDLPDDLKDAELISSVVQRSNVHLLGISLRQGTCNSRRLKITRQTTEYTFHEKGIQTRRELSRQSTMHNCLIDCHADVWIRYPIIPAIARETILSQKGRRKKSLLFTATQHRHAFSPYFRDTIQMVERNTRKPMGPALLEIDVRGEPFSSVVDDSLDTDWHHVSTLMAGEWLVNLICLIPIHIAVARDNRFIPLKDGVWTVEHERSLLGAEVFRIVDSLSFGWYESVFQSYLSTKPVRVVSSMGEQSVGKSYALNHFVDTSFAGSAMRTTEGVWMSVTPTSESLIVALDFEGDIERSTQEDTLLVLFNTAISNLVLFRNNFAISREISNLFQSFQSSSSVLDPATNPTLFQSALVIIIKASITFSDVIDSDMIEIRQEFALKFQKMVEDEQASNFLTRLHKGQVSIIPWPVIESRHFYSLFGVLKKQLHTSAPTYTEAGMFLHTLKVLMAKLKANDWGSMSQTVAIHRAQHLHSLLPRALAYGAVEVEPTFEPLRNFDSNSVIAADDTDVYFWVKSLHADSEADDFLLRICKSWPDFDKRHSVDERIWLSQLTEYFDNLVTLRLSHVLEWINSNVSRFTAGGSHAAIDNLRRSYEAESVEIRRVVRLCMTKCASCHLLCIQSKHHEGSHDCTTSHSCPHLCQFDQEHAGIADICYLAAGHGGVHICNVIPHLCGEVCQLESKIGCQGRCTKNASHPEDEHLCSARVHACGLPCDLDLPAILANQERPCGGFCMTPWDEAHERHLCDKGMVCPFSCQLCKRSCATMDHLHGLDSSAVHSCLREHSCPGICSAIGACEIETQPQSVEATFTGRHETFQYTKYSQVAKRLPCAVVIPPGALNHDGAHIHSTEGSPFHYCKTRCESCGYLCTLPQGHPQRQHETSHGSMSKTYWAVANPDGVFELNGHKFGSNDDGAPMLCSLFCRNMGRHVHIDYCRAQDELACSHPETKHIAEPLQPNPERSKDWTTHSLYWSRLDPYSKEEQVSFAKCDARCRGPEHDATPTRAAQPSHCILPVFHPPEPLDSARFASGLGHISGDGHVFMCKNPSVMRQAFHVYNIYKSRSSSMGGNDRGPLADTPSTARILASANNRFGAVCSSLYAFWTARANTASQMTSAARRDSYSVVLFDQAPTRCFANDFSRTPDDLLEALLQYGPVWGTNFDDALLEAQTIMEDYWSTERAPVVIFLSDGECGVTEDRIYDICRAAVRLGKPLSFHAVSFGQNRLSASLRRMAEIAEEVASAAPRDPLIPAAALVGSQYTEALDTVNLANTFLGIAESLRTPYASLLRA